MQYRAKNNRKIAAACVGVLILACVVCMVFSFNNIGFGRLYNVISAATLALAVVIFIRYMICDYVFVVTGGEKPRLDIFRVTAGRNKKVASLFIGGGDVVIEKRKKVKPKKLLGKISYAGAFEANMFAAGYYYAFTLENKRLYIFIECNGEFAAYLENTVKLIGENEI